MHVTAHLDVDLIALESADSVTCMLTLQAPVLDSDRSRAGQTLLVVLDRSGSMSGAPLETAKEALRHLVRRLAPQDRFGLVVFDDQAQLIVPVRAASDHDLALVDALIASIHAGGSTDLWAGYNLALREVARSLSSTHDRTDVVEAATVVLISDGHANAGITDPTQLRERALTAFKNDAVTTATIGLGLGYDEVLLSAISDGGSGAHRFAANADDLPAALAEEVDGLLDKSVLAATVRVAGRGDTLTGVATLQGLPTWMEDTTTVIALGDLYAGEERMTLIRLDVASIPALGLATIADVVLEYTALPDQAEHAVTLPITVNVVPGDVAAGRVPMPEVVVEQLRVEAAQAKAAASESLRQGDAASAKASLDNASASLGSLAKALDVLRRHGHLDPARSATLQATIAAETEELTTLRRDTDDMPAGFTSKAMMMAASGGRRGRAAKRPAPGADKCPICAGALGPVVYGMVADPGDDVIIGGCVIGPDDPTHGCENCGWRGRP